MPDGVLLQRLAEPPLLWVFLISTWAHNTTPLAGMSSFFFKTRISGPKTGFEGFSALLMSSFFAYNLV
jgi:hypothetical protein